jgi:hypothetical protein
MGRYACQWTMGGIDCESTMIRMSNYVVYGWQNYPTQSDGLISHFLFSTIYINIWDNPSHWLIFFKMVKPPTRYFFFCFCLFLFDDSFKISPGYGRAACYSTKDDEGNGVMIDKVPFWGWPAGSLIRMTSWNEFRFRPILMITTDITLDKLLQCRASDCCTRTVNL